VLNIRTLKLSKL